MELFDHHRGDQPCLRLLLSLRAPRGEIPVLSRNPREAAQPRSPRPHFCSSFLGCITLCVVCSTIAGPLGLGRFLPGGTSEIRGTSCSLSHRAVTIAACGASA